MCKNRFLLINYEYKNLDLRKSKPTSDPTVEPINSPISASVTEPGRA